MAHTLGYIAAVLAMLEKQSSIEAINSTSKIRGRASRC
jgi:hypothetical protein